MLMPKRVKRRKQFRGSMRGKATRGNVICYGEFGLVATEPCWIRSNQMGQPFPVKVTDKTEKTITFDANHEMAGKELNFKIELVEVK